MPDMNLAEIAQWLSPARFRDRQLARARASASASGPGRTHGATWHETLTFYGRDAREWDEARTAAALDDLPRGVTLRWVLLDDAEGPALRWLVDGSREAEKALGGYFHDDLLHGEGDEHSRTGYLELPETRRSWRDAFQ